jgi:hypothetical protein
MKSQIYVNTGNETKVDKITWIARILQAVFENVA